jgi:uncharacterized membrane protein YgdD (TMEM256/DUF423 family)
MMNSSTVSRLAALFGATGVGLGAFGAHGLATRLTALGHVATWETAARYHLLHAVVLLAVGLWQQQRPNRPDLSRAAWCFSLGILFFSGSLYVLSLTGARWLGPITPTGGVLLIAGWLLLARAAGTSSAADVA